MRSQYYPEQSNPLKDQYIFVYKVKITNQTRQTVQLVSRSWEIKAVEASEVCKGEGGKGLEVEHLLEAHELAPSPEMIAGCLVKDKVAGERISYVSSYHAIHVSPRRLS